MKVCANKQIHHMMTSSNGNIFRVTGPMCREFKRPVTRSFDVWWGGPGDLRRYRAHYDVIVMRCLVPNLCHLLPLKYPLFSICITVASYDRTKIHQSSKSMAFCEVKSTVNSPYKVPVKQKVIPYVIITLLMKKWLMDTCISDATKPFLTCAAVIGRAHPTPAYPNGRNVSTWT